jgi:hypothetical protein
MIYINIISVHSCDSLIDTVTSLWTGQQRNCGVISGRGNIFLISRMSSLTGPTSLFFSVYWDPFLRSKVARPWSWPLPSSTKFKKEWCHTSTPLHFFMLCTGSNFTFNINSSTFVQYLSTGQRSKQCLMFLIMKSR